MGSLMPKSVNSSREATSASEAVPAKPATNAPHPSPASRARTPLRTVSSTQGATSRAARGPGGNSSAPATHSAATAHGGAGVLSESGITAPTPTTRARFMVGIINSASRIAPS